MITLQKDILMFYREIVQINLDDKEKIEKVGKEMICRDLCPRHLLDEMRMLGEAQLAEFNELYNNESVVLHMYGSDKGKEVLDVLHEQLDFLLTIVEIFTQVSTFADDWFKKTLTEQGVVEWTL